MGFDEGSIVLNSENETYYAGQTIFGKLVFEQDKVKTFRGLYVKVKGFCKVHWTTSHTRRENNRSHTYHENHDSYEEYFSRKVFLLGGEHGEYHLQCGKHELPFDCPIPANCPSSFEGQYGHVRYEIKAVVDRAFKIDQNMKKKIRVIAPLDLNIDPYSKEPIQFDIEDTYTCCCMSNGSSETVVKLPVSGYCSGQSIPIEINCSNQGQVEIDDIKLAIKKRVTYHATQSPGTKHESETVVQIKKGPIPGNTTRSWMVDMELPAIDVYNMGPCRYIDMDFEFKVTVSPESCHSDSEDTRRIVFGTVPLIGYQDNVPNPLQDQMPKVMSPIVNQPMPTVEPYPSPYPTQNSPYPGQRSPYLNQNPPYPSQTPPYPVQNTPYPVENSSYPGQVPPYPSQNQPYPAQNPPYPGTTQPYPGQNPHYPVSPNQNPYPGVHSISQSAPYAGNSYPQNSPSVSPYPTPNIPSSLNPNPSLNQSPPLKTGTLGFVQTGNVSVPSLPPGANVPYPTTPSSNPYAAASAPAPTTPNDEKNAGLNDPSYTADNPKYVDKKDNN